MLVVSLVCTALHISRDIYRAVILSKIIGGLAVNLGGGPDHIRYVSIAPNHISVAELTVVYSHGFEVRILRLLVYHCVGLL